MADYNVNMKQWNGSSFDNVLPLAFNSKALEGKSYDDIIQYAKQYTDEGKLLLYSGQYTGTGTYGVSNPNSVTLPFAPALFFMPSSDGSVTNIIRCNYLTTDFKEFVISVSTRVNKAQIKKSTSGSTISWYSTGNADYQENASGNTYYYVAIGGADLGGQIEWIITSSGTWTVPRTGRYLLELYGGGGCSKINSFVDSYQGGSSGNSWSSVELAVGTKMAVSIGAGGTPTNTTADRKTTFGSYSVDGGGDGNRTTAGTGAGNLGTDGQMLSGYNTISGGQLVAKDGYEDIGAGGLGGVSNKYNGSDGKPGAVYLKYLGA